jgi:hypothetical protein
MKEASFKHVELILEINKTVIVASSWCSIFTLPTRLTVCYGSSLIVLDMAKQPLSQIVSAKITRRCFIKRAIHSQLN